MNAIPQLADSAAHHLVTITTASILSVAVAAIAVKRYRNDRASTGQTAETAEKKSRRRKVSAGTLAAITAFVICTSVSLNTSYRFTGDPGGLAMTSTVERVLACAAFESLMAMCVLGARERLADDQERSGGWYGTAVWVFAALSSVPAFVEGNGLTAATLVRIIVGSFGSALAAHSALGLELRHRTGDESRTATAQIMRDLRERLMARLGLAHRARTAQEIAQERALDSAVDLADKYDRLPDKSKGKGARLAKRLARAQDRAGIATDESQRQLYRARVAQRRYATELDLTEAESPWNQLTAADEDEYARAVETLERHTRHMEDLADEAEDAVAAQLGTPAQAHGGTPLPLPRAEEVVEDDGEPADCIETEDEAQPEPSLKAVAAQTGTSTITARVPHQADEEHDRDREPQPLGDLRSYPTKRAALEALYAVRIPDDDQRNTNVITEALLAELAAGGITLSRPTAHRYISDLRPQTHDEQAASEAHERVEDTALAHV